MQFTLTQKVFILVVVPLVFELGIVGGLAFLFHQAEQERVREAHAIEITTQLNVLLRMLLERSFTFTLKRVSGSDAFDQPFKLAAKSMKSQVEELEKTFSNDPAERAVLNKIKVIATEANTSMLAARDALEDDDRVTVMMHWIKVRKGIKQLYSIIDETIAHQIAIQRKQAEEQARTRRGIEILLICGALGNVVIALLLSKMFNRDTTDRIKVLLQNTVKLASDEPLNPPLRGRDEIATLDRFFRNMAGGLAEARRKERAVVDNVLDVICSIDSEGKFIAVNPAAEKVWGIEPQELIGQRILNLIIEEDAEKMKTALSRFMEEQSSGTVDSRIRRGDGAEREMQWTMQWSPEESALFCVAHDVTERKELERMKRDFVAMVSHDLKTPLTSIQMVHELLEAEAYGELNEDGHDSLRTADENVTRLIKLVNDLLDIERIESGEVDLDLVPVKINAIVEKSVQSVKAIADKEEISLETMLAETDPVVTIDRDSILQVIVNLLSNAIKFSPKGQTIDVHVIDEDGDIEISVIDRGRGVPPEMQERIFERFKQTNTREDRKKGGTGLGLAIAKAFVERHRGQIGVESTEGEGSRFWFRLPKNVANKGS